MSIVIKCAGWANPQIGEHPYLGQYLQSADFDAHDGVGEVGFTPWPDLAMKFPDRGAAFTYWKTASTVRPVRYDGQVNRPLTAMNVILVSTLDLKPTEIRQ